MLSWFPIARDDIADPLRIGINPWPGYEFAMLAESLGYFEDEGVDVRMVELASLGDCRRAFERGQIDGMFSTMVEVMVTERARAGDLSVVLAADYSAGADQIIARSGIGSVEALRGRTIAAEPGTLTEFILSRALHEAGLGFEDVQVRWMPALEMVRAFETGSIDAAVCYPPISVRLHERGGRTIFDTRAMPGVVLDVLAFERSFVASHRDAIGGFCRAFFRAQRYAERHPHEAYAFMAARESISPADFASALHDGVTLLSETDQQVFMDDHGHLADIRRIIGEELDRLEHLERRVQPWVAVDPDGVAP